MKLELVFQEYFGKAPVPNYFRQAGKSLHHGKQPFLSAQGIDALNLLLCQHYLSPGTTTRLVCPKEMLKPLHGALLKNNQWLARIFGEDPQKKYLHAYSDGGEVIDCLPNFDLKLLLERGKDERPIEPSEIKLYQEEVSGVSGSPPPELGLHVTRKSVREEWLISADTLGRGLAFQDRVNVFVKYKEFKSIAVFWICESEVFGIYPDPDAALKVPQVSRGILLDGHRWAKIPAGDGFKITTKGTQDCCLMVLDFNCTVEALRERIVEAVVSPMAFQRLPKPTAVWHSLREKSPKAKKRFEGPDESESWSYLFLKKLIKDSEIAHLIAVPVDR